MSKHRDHVHLIAVPFDLTWKIRWKRLDNISLCYITLGDFLAQRIQSHAYHPSTLITSGFFLYRRRRHKAAFFLTSGLQLLENWRNKKLKSISFIFQDWQLHSANVFHLQVTFEHPVLMIQQILSRQCSQPAEIFMKVEVLKKCKVSKDLEYTYDLFNRSHNIPRTEIFA